MHPACLLSSEIRERLIMVWRTGGRPTRAATNSVPGRDQGDGGMRYLASAGPRLISSAARARHMGRRCILTAVRAVEFVPALRQAGAGEKDNRHRRGCRWDRMAFSTPRYLPGMTALRAPYVQPAAAARQAGPCIRNAGHHWPGPQIATGGRKKKGRRYPFRRSSSTPRHPIQY